MTLPFRSTLCVVALFGIARCGGGAGAPPGGGANDGGAEDATAEAEAGARPDDALRLDFERVKPGNDFVAVVTASASKTVHVSSTRGAVGAVSDAGGGIYRARIAAAGTGEYVVRATLDGSTASAEKTAVVLATVGDRWGQPEAYGGLVNTPAWEDSECLSPDGEWLFLEYLPVSLSCARDGLDSKSPVCSKARGPWTAPARPNMPGASRIASDGTITNGCPSLGLPDPSFATIIQTLYGFHRQADGSFAEPFVLPITGADGCVSAYGPSLLPPRDGKSLLVFAFDDPRDDGTQGDTKADLFTTQLVFGAPTTLGQFDAAGGFTMNATALGIPKASSQGNPSVWADASSAVKGVLYDDESLPDADQDLWVQTVSNGGSFPAGPWAAATKLPPPLSTPGAKDYQPFFDAAAKEALWSQNQNIVSARLLGTSMTDAASWSPLAVELSPGTGALTAIGTIVIVGEPTKAIRGGREVLSFVYGLVASDGTLDINVAFVEAQP